jgi:hypothetical protein
MAVPGYLPDSDLASLIDVEQLPQYVAYPCLGALAIRRKTTAACSARQVVVRHDTSMRASNN